MAKHHKKVPTPIENVSGTKTPKTSFDVSGKKVPKSAEGVNYLELKASWRVNKIQTVEPYGWHGLNFDQFNYIKEKLSNFETMTWGEIFVGAKKQNHSIPVAQLRCEHARRWMRNNMPDQLELWTIRFTGPERVWGVFSEGAYQIVFWDPNHLIYPTQR
jgi:hypothetical protein